MASSTSSIGGLVSGLDTSTLITQLMAVAAQPQAKLKASLSTTNAQVTAAQSINAKAASMTALAKDLATPKTYTTSTASSTDASVTVKSSGTNAAGSVTFSVTQVATAYSVVTGYLNPVTYQSGSSTPDPVAFEITPHGGASVQITAASGSAADLVSAINASNAGVNATAVSDRDGTRLVLTSKTAGGTSDFSDTFATRGAESVLTSAQDAVITLGNGVLLTSPTNTFTNLLSGVDVTVSSISGYDTNGFQKQVTVSSAVSADGISGKLGGLVTAMNTVLTDLAFHTKQLANGVTPSATNGGLLSGASAFRGLGDSLLASVSANVGRDAAVQAGVSVSRDGQVTFDAAAFSSLYASNPGKAQQVLTAFATAVQSVGSAASDPLQGSVSAYITGGKSSARTLTDRIADWDTRLALKQSQLTAQYAALETALSRLKSQSDSLTSALAQLTSN